MMPRLFVDVTPLRNNRSFRYLFTGQFVSLLGSNVTLVAIPYQVYRATHSSLWVGLASALQLPFLIVGALWGGALGDRFDRRTLMTLASLVLALLSGGLALNAHWSASPLILLLALAALSAGVGGVAGPLRTAAIPTLVAPDELVSAYSLNQVIVNVATVVGPALAGVLLAGVGLTWCYLLDGASFLLLALATSRMAPLPPVHAKRALSTVASVRAGFTYVRQHALAQAVYLVDLNAMIFGLPRALFPAVALDLYHGGPRSLGLLYAAPGAGAVLMAVGAGWIQHVRRRGRLVTLAVAGWGAAMALFGLVHLFWLGLVCLAVAGAMDVISTILRNTILQTAITDEYRSRLSSIQLAVVTGGPRIGDVESGLVAGATSTEFSIVSGGLLCLAGVVALIKWRPHLWRNEALTDAA